MNDENITLVPFENKYFRQLMDLVRTGWNPNHVLLKSEKLFYWHFSGFGRLSGLKFPLLLDGDKLIGYRMMTPIEIIVSDEKGNHRIVTSSASSLYYVDNNYRGKKLGVKLEDYVIDYYGGYVTIAANPTTAVPILKKSGCKMIDSMLRWFRPLSNDLTPITIFPKYDGKPVKANIIQPVEITPNALYEIWINSISNKSITSLYRSKDYWQWRYMDDPIYRYHFFENDNGIVVARVCSLFDQNENEIEQKVLRILEVIPRNSEIWDGKKSSGLSALIDGVCGWGQSQGCIAAEFYMSTHRLDEVMKDSYFEEINSNELLAGSIMSYFEPMSTTPRLSNVGIMSSYVSKDFSFYNSYFTLSDADQDRPNIIPKR